MNQRKRATVLIIDEQSTRSICISHTMLKAIKPALWTLSISTTVLAAALSYLAWQHWQTQQQAAELAQEVTDLQQFTSAEIEAKLKGLSQSERTVLQLQQYLNARGVDVKPISSEPPAGTPNDAAGGPEIKLAAPVPYMQHYSEQTENLLSALRKIPLGVPHKGSISSRFGVRANPFSGQGAEGHNGLDFRGQIGEPIHATADGTVILASNQNGYGNVVKIQHGYGYQTLYGHLSAIDVKNGQKIKAGDIIGKLGNTGRSTGPHLHYEVRRNEGFHDPENFLTLGNLQDNGNHVQQ